MGYHFATGQATCKQKRAIRSSPGSEPAVPGLSPIPETYSTNLSDNDPGTVQLREYRGFACKDIIHIRTPNASTDSASNNNLSAAEQKQSRRPLPQPFHDACGLDVVIAMRGARSEWTPSNYCASQCLRPGNPYVRFQGILFRTAFEQNKEPWSHCLLLCEQPSLRAVPNKTNVLGVLQLVVGSPHQALVVILCTS